MKASTVLLGQGIFYVVTGLWPVIHVRSFEAITGKKKEHWLLYTVGLLIVASGVVFTYAGWNERASMEVMLLATLNCLFLAAIDVTFALRKVIAKVYLLDAVTELIIVALLWTGAR